MKRAVRDLIKLIFWDGTGLNSYYTSFSFS